MGMLEDTQGEAWFLTVPLPVASGGWVPLLLLSAMGEKERFNGFCAMVRGRSEEPRAVRNWLMVATCLPTFATLKSEDHTEPAPTLTVQGILGPAPHPLLQQENWFHPPPQKIYPSQER